MKRAIILITTTLLLICSSVTGLPPDKSNSITPKSTADDYSSYINGNNLLMLVSNVGHLAFDATGIFGRTDGLYYPYTSISDIESDLTNTVVYSSGLWLGGKINNQEQVAIAEYATSFSPGTISGSPSPNEFDNTNDIVKSYKLYSDSLADNPNSDYLNWPVADGAPINPDGTPQMLGEQMIWSVFNSSNQDIIFGSDPLGVEIHQTVWNIETQSNDTPVDNVVYCRYILHNRSNNNIEEMYLGFWADPDLGGAGDDYVGCDSANNIGFSYNATNSDAVYGSKPPAYGFKFIYGPLVPTPGEKAMFDGYEIADHKNLPMTSFTRFTSGTDPYNKYSCYAVLKGLNIDGNPYINYYGNPTNYMFSGNPINGMGEIDFNPSDRRMLGSSGPFNMAPGDSQYVVLSIGVGQGSDRFTSITALKYYLEYTSYIPTDINDDNPPPLPNSFALNQNYPNPFNPTTTISFDLPNKAEVNLDIFNILGQQVKSLVNQQLPAGYHEVKWNGTNEIGERVSSGIYLYKLITDKNKASKKMLLLK